jgi:hypothetical protein
MMALGRLQFVRDLDTNMSNANAQMVLNALGIPTDDELCGHMNRVQFANLCASWLQQQHRQAVSED